MSTRRPPRLCSCGTQIIPHGQLCHCQITARRERNARHDATRGNAAARGYGREWREESKAYLKANPSCVMCEADGRQTLATCVDHVIPHRGDMALFWNRANWQGLCFTCHNSVKQRLERRRRTRR